jgi:hypothetical protein
MSKKRSNESEKLKSKKAKIRKNQTIVLDIEGTTTPISFVHDTLFPYIIDHIAKFLADNWNSAECQEHVKSLLELVEFSFILVSKGFRKQVCRIGSDY